MYIMYINTLLFIIKIFSIIYIYPLARARKCRNVHSHKKFEIAVCFFYLCTMSNFLVKYDFSTLIDGENLDEITDGNDQLLEGAVMSAVEEVAGYIRHRYDAGEVFREVVGYSDTASYSEGDRVFWSETVFSDTTSYSLGDRVSFDGDIYMANTVVSPGQFDPLEWDFLAVNNTFYTSLQATVGNLPVDPLYFSAGDNRNPKIKEVTIDVALYNIHSKISPRNIPDVRRVRYDGFGNKNDSENAIRYLEKVQKGQIMPDLPAITPNVQNTERWAYGISPTKKYNY